MGLNLSVVIPLYNEEESIQELCEWIKQVVDVHRISYEIILIDDGSTDDSWSVIEDLHQSNRQVKGLRFKRNYGKSAALQMGFSAAEGEVIITMDADLQDSPDEIPDLYKMISEEGYDLVSGWKKKRYDPISKTLPTKLFNYVTRKVSGLELNDFNCGLKAYRRKAIQSVEIYGEMHRYIPYMVANAGYRKITEKIVQHRARKYGKTKFGINRFINGFLDLLTLYFISSFGKKPMHFFGLIGSLFTLAGFAILLLLSIQKIFFEVGGIATRPLFFFGILSLIVGTQLFVTGFLAELITRNSQSRNKYLIEDSIALDKP
jgi:glycosyltransferase involved in cell wall biosynthesis